MRNLLWRTLLLVLCIVSVASYASVSVAQQENDSFSFPSYYSSNRVDKHLDSVTESLERHYRQLPETKDGNLKSITVVDYSAPSPLLGKEIPFSASSIDPCGDGSNRFATEEGGIRWMSFPITYAIDTSNSGVDPTTARNAVIGAFNEFDTFMPGQAFAISNNFGTAEITFEWQPIDGPGGGLGFATFFYNPSTLEIVSAEIVLDSGDNWFDSTVQSCAGMGNSFDIQNVATHELGHAVGIGHVNDNLLTMFPTAAAGETLKRSLGNGDRAGLHVLYPPGWSQWSSLSGGLRDNSDPAIIANSDGRLQVFIVGHDNRLYTKWQNTAGATTSWSPYLRLGGGIEPGTSPAVVMNSDGRLQVFIVGHDNRLYTKWQNTAGSVSSWSPYLNLGGGIEPGTSPAVERNSNGRLQVFIIGHDNRLYSKWQNSAGSVSSWSSYLNLGGGIEPGTSPAVERNSDGRLQVFIVGHDNRLYSKWQNTAGATTNWSPYLRLDGVIDINTSPAVARNWDGRLEVFVVWSDNALYHKWQTFS